VKERPASNKPARAAIEQVARGSYGKLLALLIHQYQDIELSEDVLQDAILAALQHWPLAGLPENPPGWLLQTARRKAIDRLRRVHSFSKKSVLIQQEIASKEDPEDSMMEIPDQRLSLIFTCCHPALAEPLRAALTLKTLCGLSTEQIANAFLVGETTMAQRLVRAKKKIKTAGIPYEIPPAHLIDERLSAVLAVIYLIFNEGYFSSIEGELITRDLCDEAIRLAEVMVELIPDQTEAWGLLALMLFHYSRFEARIAANGELIDLTTQDRKRWDKKMIRKADKMLQACLIKAAAGSYQIQAAISAVHAHATHFDETDWQQIVMLYLRLDVYDANPVIKLNLAVALSYAEGADVGLNYLDQIADLDKLQDYYPYFAAKADMQRRLGNFTAARKMYASAIRLCSNSVEKSYLTNKLSSLHD
jgi:RNA polymerase sigma-70 factor (ECF subfamily)